MAVHDSTGVAEPTVGVEVTADRWTVAPEDRDMVMSKRGSTRLGFAILLVFFRHHSRFPRDESEVERRAIVALSQQINLPIPAEGGGVLTERSAERFRAEIRTYFGFREATVADAIAMTDWLRDYAAPESGSDLEVLVERLKARCRDQAIEPPAPERTDRIVRAAQRAHVDRFHATVYSRLLPETRKSLDDLLRLKMNESEQTAESTPGNAPAALLRLRGNPGRPSLASLQNELANLEMVRRINLPLNLFEHVSPRDLEICRRRVAVEAPHELRRHPDDARITWLAAFIYLRTRSLIDDLVDLLIDTIHRIGARAERKVERELLDDLRSGADLCKNANEP